MQFKNLAKNLEDLVAVDNAIAEVQADGKP